jgi:hypothetical protein
MPEANVLYSVTAAVAVGLVIWVLVVLKTAKEPWARTLPLAAAPGDAADSAVAAEALGVETPSPQVLLDADSTARATPVAIANERQSKSDG